MLYACRTASVYNAVWMQIVRRIMHMRSFVGDGRDTWRVICVGI